MPCLLFLWPFVACHQTQAFVNLDPYIHVGQSWGINLLSQVQGLGPSMLSRLTWEVGASAVQRNMDGTCAHPLNVRRAPGQTPAMWPSGCSVWLLGLPFVRRLTILMSWGVRESILWPLVLVPPCPVWHDLIEKKGKFRDSNLYPSGKDF